jgi:hypothetical protein
MSRTLSRCCDATEELDLLGAQLDRITQEIENTTYQLDEIFRDITSNENMKAGSKLIHVLHHMTDIHGHHIEVERQLLAFCEEFEELIEQKTDTEARRNELIKRSREKRKQRRRRSKEVQIEGQNSVLKG